MSKNPARNNSLLRDGDIRPLLHDWLWAEHSGSEDTSILHEVSIPRPSARMDVAVVNGAICGFEIKSDADRLTRLRDQEPAFSAVCDKVSIVVTRRHLKRSRAAIPHWWGIVLVNCSGEQITFEEKRKPRDNTRPNNRALLYMLTRAELRGVLRTRGTTKLTQSELIEHILATLAADDIRHRVREVLKGRSTFSYSSSSSSPKNASRPGA